MNATDPTHPASTSTPAPGTGARLRGGTAIITGSTSGIGAAIAGALAAEGARVVVSGRDAVRGKEVVDRIRAAGGHRRRHHRHPTPLTAPGAQSRGRHTRPIQLALVGGG